MVQRVAVVGAGCSGLACIKCCLDEGLEPVCFESSDDIGGLWRFKEKPEPGRAKLYSTVVSNSSKEMMAYSDFPPPAHFPNNMHHTVVLQYLRLYAQHFSLLRHISFQTTVHSVQQRPDFSISGQWEVLTVGRDGEEETHVFDAVMVCSGHFTQPHLPLQDIKGIQTFNGRYFHSWEYSSAGGLEGKTVLVIGIGNSGGDIAVDVSRVAKQVFLSSRSGAWVVPRVGDGGLPVDVVSGIRLASLLMWLLPSWIDGVMKKKLNQRFNHRLYGLQPSHGIFSQLPVVNDDLPGRIISGRVVIKPNVKEFCGSSIVFEDGTVVDKMDVVIFATGYEYDFPFLPVALQTKAGHRLTLYKHVFPPSLEKATLAVVGFIHGLGSIIPLAEMQARWACLVFKGLRKLPPEKLMLQDIHSDTKRMHQRFACSERNPLQVDYIHYMEDVAQEVGVKPQLFSLLLREPALGLRVLLGPFTPYQYRLRGRGQWPGARHAIHTLWERIYCPFGTRLVPEPRPERKWPMFVFVALGASGVFLLCYTQRKHSAFH
ncbi:dimethylaniline monooxygenase [N-oxide-forming] 5-like [Denticeps clupeoides]|uniref:dimethylaniline monooxygenase [N-oxide-forming] 5-like n=1 Tax=Denticeps clupeoides TaxID=299321 RepID=UPI0010A56959|nr:dimethylaniline monooxygenase [N-oxide-forming] 5-like [Denticeps clupeoides]